MDDKEFKRELLKRTLLIQKELSRARRRQFHLEAQLRSLEADGRELKYLLQLAEWLDPSVVLEDVCVTETVDAGSARS